MDEQDPHEEEAQGEETAQREEGEASPVEGFSAMERLGRSFLEKHEESRSDLGSAAQHASAPDTGDPPGPDDRVEDLARGFSSVS